MKRREFITLLGGAAAAWPLAARAQQPSDAAHRRVSWPRAPTTRNDAASCQRRSVQGLQRTGLDRRPQSCDRIPLGAASPSAHAAVRRNWSRLSVGPVIAAGLQRRLQARAARRPRTIPIVFATVADPVGAGFVAQPGAAGRQCHRLYSLRSSASGGKRLELLHETLPAVTRVSCTVGIPASRPRSISAARCRPCAPSLADRRRHAQHEPRDRARLCRFARVADAAEVVSSADRAVQPFDRATDRSRWQRGIDLPAIYVRSRQFVEAGGLMSYGADISRTRIGRRPSTSTASSRARSPPTCRSQQPTKFELVINLKTAKALGLDVPPSLLARADEVIE